MGENLLGEKKSVRPSSYLILMTHNYLGHFRIFRYNDFYAAAVGKFLNFSTLNSYTFLHIIFSMNYSHCKTASWQKDF